MRVKTSPFSHLSSAAFIIVSDLFSFLNSAGIACSDTAVKKLSSLFGSDDSDWIEVDFSGWANEKEEAEIFEDYTSCPFIL